MRVEFGMYLDGAVWSRKAAVIGEVRTGPMGLLGILETKLGISKPERHPVYRIDEYMKRLKANDGKKAWFHQSFAVDQWSTSRQMLKWRDELVEVGWRGGSLEKASPRLKALSDLEKLDIPLSDGRSDRLRKVIDCLERNKLADISAVYLMEPLDKLPPVWQKIISLLKNQDTQIDNYKEISSEKKETNLSSIQDQLTNLKNIMPLSEQDDTLILLEADNEWEAAEHLALWLASKPEANEDVTIICGMNTGVLDQTLKRHGLPYLGRSELSKWREIQQIFPLVLANAWNPVDVHLMAELLSLSTSPISKWVCRYLLKAIAEEPGVGGRAWSDALEKIRIRQQEYFEDKGDAKAVENTQKFVQEIQSILVEDRYDPIVGIPEEKLRERCQRIITWATRKINDEPMMTEVINQARDIQMISRGKAFIPRITLDRMLDTVIGAGSISDYISEEVAPWHVVDHPGQIADKCKEIIWWGFNEPATEIQTYWSKQERETLSAVGLEIEESKNYRYRESQAWKKGLLYAENRFIGICIAQIDGEEAYHHPLMDSILSAAVQTTESTSEEDIHSYLVRKTKDIGENETWEFAGRKNKLVEVEKAAVISAKPVYQVPKSVVKMPEKLSYSQMNTLIGCSMKWSLEYYADIRLSESQSIPTGNQMIGTLCHRIIEELYSGKIRIDDADLAGRTAGDLYDRLIQSMASELLLDGNAIEKHRYRDMIIEAVRDLVKSVNKLNLTVEKIEAPLEAEIDKIPFIGYADMLLRDSFGNPFILDLKWSFSSKYRKKEIEDGGSLQLASYAWMITTAEKKDNVDAGYFMLAQGQLISDSSLLADEAVEAIYPLDKVWEMGVKSLNDTCSSIDSGMIEASGIKERIKAIEEEMDDKEVREFFKQDCQQKEMLYQNPPCNFCDFKRLCGLTGGSL